MNFQILNSNSHAGLLIDSLSNATGSSLKKNALTLFCSLLIHRFQVPTREGSGSIAEYEAMIEALKHTLDVDPKSHSTGRTEASSNIQSVGSQCIDFAPCFPAIGMITRLRRIHHLVVSFVMHY